MALLNRYSVSQRVITYEVIAFISIILFIWLDEIIDIPSLLLGSEATPVNWRESLFESICILTFGIIFINFTYKIFKRMKYLEGMLPVCASCKKIRDENGNWHQIETYIRERSAIEFSHGICPDCFEKLYPDIAANKKRMPDTPQKSPVPMYR